MIGIGTMPFTADPLVDEIMCLAIQNPGTLYARDINGNIQSGLTFSLITEAWGCCDAEGTASGQVSWYGYYVPVESCVITASVGGTGVGSYLKPNPDYPPNPPEFLETASGCVGYAGAGGVTMTDVSIVDDSESPDFCVAVGNWQGTKDAQAGPFSTCCPVSIVVNLYPGFGTKDTVGDGACVQSITCTISVTPEGP